MTFEVCITEHCNLNCVGCSHFAPLAEPYFMDLEVFRNDMARLSALLGDRVEWIHIMGGEPLLHPQCADFLAVSREYFPTTRIDLITNALLLPYQTDEFWKTCRDRRISLKPTRYPVTVDLRKVKETAEGWGVAFRIFNHEDDGGEKKMIKYVLDPVGRQIADEALRACRAHRSRNCLDPVRFWDGIEECAFFRYATVGEPLIKTIRQEDFTLSDTNPRQNRERVLK